jgi:hypothetical protein
MGLESGYAMSSLSRAEGFVSPGPLPRGCTTPPPFPSDTSLDQNISSFSGSTIWNLDADIDAKNFLRRGGIWDYRTNRGQQYDNAGNYNFGAIAATMKLPYYMTQNLAGLYQGEGAGSWDSVFSLAIWR